MSPFLCNLLQDSEEYGEDQVLIFPDVESEDLGNLGTSIQFINCTNAFFLWVNNAKHDSFQLYSCL